MSAEPKIGDLRVWHIPQIPSKPFHVPVAGADEALKVIDILSGYDLFQYKNRIKGDYANVNGLECYYATGNDGESPGWCEWRDEETDDDIHEFRRNRT